MADCTLGCSEGGVVVKIMAVLGISIECPLERLTNHDQELVEKPRESFHFHNRVGGGWVFGLPTCPQLPARKSPIPCTRL